MVLRLAVLIFLFMRPFFFLLKMNSLNFLTQVRPNEESSTVVLHWHLMDKMPFSEYRDNHNGHNIQQLFFYFKISFHTQIKKVRPKSDFNMYSLKYKENFLVFNRCKWCNRHLHFEHDDAESDPLKQSQALLLQSEPRAHPHKGHDGLG